MRIRKVCGRCLTAWCAIQLPSCHYSARSTRVRCSLSCTQRLVTAPTHLIAIDYLISVSSKFWKFCTPGQKDMLLTVCQRLMYLNFWQHLLHFLGYFVQSSFLSSCFILIKKAMNDLQLGQSRTQSGGGVCRDRFHPDPI